MGHNVISIRSTLQINKRHRGPDWKCFLIAMQPWPFFSCRKPFLEEKDLDRG